MQLSVGKYQFGRKALVIVGLAILGFMLFNIISNLVNSRKVKDLRADNRQLKIENRILQKQMDSLNQQYILDSIVRADFIIQGDVLREERDAISKDLRSLAQQLLKYTNAYGKTRDYNFFSDDSLARLFNDRFDRK